MLFFLLTSSIGDHNEMEVDWGSDEKEVSVAQATPADTVKAEAELEGLSGEAEQNLLDLLEAQKVSNQALLARLERLDAERVTELQRQELLDMVLNRDPGFVAKLASLPTPVLLEVEDKQGMSLLHHAVRLGLADVVEGLVAHCPEAVAKTTHVDGRPSRWTPLMVLMDTNLGSIGDENYERIMRCLLRNMSVQSISAQAYSGQTAAHLAAAQGNLWALKKICWTMYTKAGETDAAFRQVKSMLNARSGKRGAGTVDIALGNNLMAANYLKVWGGEELCPNPKKFRYQW